MMKKLLFISTIVVAILVAPSAALAKDNNLKEVKVRCLAKPKGAESSVRFTAKFSFKKTKSGIVIKKVAYTSGMKNPFPPGTVKGWHGWRWRTDIGLQPKYLKILDGRRKNNLRPSGVIRPNWKVSPSDKLKKLQVSFTVRWIAGAPKILVPPPNGLPEVISCQTSFPFNRL